MAWTNLEEARIQLIETTLNDIMKSIKNLASQQQLRSLSALKQKEVDDLKLRVDALEAQIALLQKNQ